MKPNQSNGYLIVASNDPIYYSWATNLISDIKDYYPEANICLVAEERFLDSRAEEADHLIICDNHYRAKLWGMSQTPYDNTFYIDADMTCISENIANVFEELGDNDMMFTGLPRDRWHIFMDTEFPGGTFTLCGAVCLYKKTDIIMEFMKDWYELYVKQHANEWWPTKEDGVTWDTENYPRELACWDQFTLWWLVEKEPKYKELKVGIFEEDLRWNYWTSLNRHTHPMPEGTSLIHLSAKASRKISDIEII